MKVLKEDTIQMHTGSFVAAMFFFVIGVLIVLNLHNQKNKVTFINSDIPTTIHDQEVAKAQKQRQVYVGFFLNNVTSLNMEDGTFYADFYLWFRWESKNPECIANSMASESVAKDEQHCISFEFMNNRDSVTIANATSVEDSWVNNENYKIYRVFGTFMFSHDFKAYPFDRLHLNINIEEAEYTLKEVRYLADPESRVSRYFQSSGWLLHQATISTKEHAYYSTLGAPNYPIGKSVSYPSANFELTLNRVSFAYLLKNLLPLIIVVFTATMIFFITPAEIGARAGFCASALLTAIALYITVNSSLPNIGYSTLMDKYFLIAFVFIGLISVQMVMTSSMHQLRPKIAMRFNNICGWFFPVLFQVSIILLTLSYL